MFGNFCDIGPLCIVANGQILKKLFRHLVTQIRGNVYHLYRFNLKMTRCITERLMQVYSPKRQIIFSTQKLVNDGYLMFVRQKNYHPH